MDPKEEDAMYKEIYELRHQLHIAVEALKVYRSLAFTVKVTTDSGREVEVPSLATEALKKIDNVYK